MSLSSYPIYLSRGWVRGNKTVIVNRRNWVLPTVNVAKSNLMGQKKKKVITNSDNEENSQRTENENSICSFFFFLLFLSLLDLHQPDLNRKQIKFQIRK